MYPLHTDNASFLVVAGRFVTEYDGTIKSTDLPFVSSITQTATSKQTTYILHLARSFSSCMYVHASTSQGNHLMSIGHDVSSTSDPCFTLTPHDPQARGNCIVNGGLMETATTPSSQITGAGDTTWNVDITACGAWIDQVFGETAAATDYCLHSGSKLLDDGQSVRCHVVVKGAAGIFALDHVMGTPATTGSEASVSRADITTAIGHSHYAQIGVRTLSRTGDTTLVDEEYTTSHSVYGDVRIRDINGWYYGLHDGSPMEGRTVYVFAVLVA